MVSLILDAISFLDILFSIGSGDLYLVSSAGATMQKKGFLLILINSVIKIIEGFCLWRMAIDNKTVSETLGDNFAVDGNVERPEEENNVFKGENQEDKEGRIFPETIRKDEEQIRDYNQSNGDL